MATPVFEETQGVVALAVPEPVSCVVNPIQAFKVPEIVGNALIVTNVVAVTGEQPGGVVVTE